MNLTLTIPESTQPPITVEVGGTTELTSYVSQVAGLPDYPATFPPAIGSAANQAVAGNDPRLTNSRTPTAHKSTHATGGSDAITPADIGAMANTNAAVNAAIADDPLASRQAAHVDGYLDPREYGTMTAGTSISAGNRTANRVAIQACLDAAGAVGKGVQIVGGPYEINDELVINYQGQQVFGSAWNYESNNQSRIIQTATDKPAFRIAMPAGGAVSTHNIVIRDLWLSGPGSSVGSAAAIDFYLDGPVGSVFSDFTNIRNVTIRGWPIGLRASKFSNSNVEKVLFFDVADSVHIGGNCNSVSFISCQFNHYGAPSTGSNFRILGSGYISVIACEAGNGGRFVSYESGVLGMRMDVRMLATESYSESSEIASNNSLFLNGFRHISSGSKVVPFKAKGGSYLDIKGDGLSGSAGYSKRSVTSISNGSPAVVTLAAHGFAEGDIVQFSTDGSLPSGVSGNQKYFVRYIDATTFNLSATRSGARANTTTAGSGTHSVEYLGCPVAYGTLAAHPQRSNEAIQSNLHYPPVIIFLDDTFETPLYSYGHTPGFTRRNDDTIHAVESMRGRTQFRLNQDNSGSNGRDSFEVCMKRGGRIIWQEMSNAALLDSIVSAASASIAPNTRRTASVVTPNVQVLTLPSTSTGLLVNDEIEILCTGTGTVNIAQNASQYIINGDLVTTTGVGGKLSFGKGGVVRLKCFNTAVAGGLWYVIYSHGTITTT